jgi:hypothetical protein
MASLKDAETRNRLWELIPKSKRISRKKFEKKALENPAGLIGNSRPS